MNCIICHDEEYFYLYRGLVKCPTCGLIFYPDDVPQEEIKHIYNENYFSGNEYLDYKGDKGIIQKNFLARLNDILKYIKKGKLFEIGTAYGFFLDLARKHFDVEGIDISETPTTYARGALNLKAQCGDFLEYQLREQKDIFCMWDTIEHLRNPHLFIRKISKEIKQGGYLFLTTGDVGSFVAKLRKDKWRLIHPPTHLYYFSVQTITSFLKKYGFQVVRVKHPGFYRSLKQIHYSLFVLKGNEKERSFEGIDLPIYLNIYDIMLVVAKKI